MTKYEIHYKQLKNQYFHFDSLTRDSFREEPTMELAWHSGLPCDGPGFNSWWECKNDVKTELHVLHSKWGCHL